MDFDLTKEEKNAIATLKRLAKRWPKSLWLFANRELTVLRRNEDGEQAMTPSGRVDQDYVVETIDLPADGGGW